MKLAYAPQSPFARKVRVVAIELGLADRIALERTLVAPGRANAEYADAVNPLRKIPALMTDDGATIVDSTVICEYLDALAGGRLVPKSGEARWRVLTAHAIAQGMMDAAILVRYETFLRPENLRWAGWIDDQWDKFLTGITWFERRPQVLSGPVDLGQIALGCGLGYADFRYPQKDWRGANPKVAGWFASVSKRPSFAETVPVD